jgi:hypothetical protein
MLDHPHSRVTTVSKWQQPFSPHDQPAIAPYIGP